MLGHRETLFGQGEPVARQFLKTQTVGPDGRSDEEKDAGQLAAEKDLGLPPLPTIARRLVTGTVPPLSQWEPGQWHTNGVTPLWFVRTRLGCWPTGRHAVR